jgi:FkbM family methyltransferase
MQADWLRTILLGAAAMVQRSLKPFGFRLSRTVAGHRIRFDPATDLGLHLLVTGRFEASSIDQCARFIQPDSIVLDIGANIGVHTVQFAVLANRGKVISFEPARSTFARLLENVGGIENVIPLNVALGETSGPSTFYIAQDDAFSGLKDTGRKPILRLETVACYRGDEIVPALVRGGRISLVKIDVEGLEVAVMRGMEQLLRAHRPVVFCEIFGGANSNPDPQGTLEFCVSLGYQAFVLADDRLIPATKHRDALYNYFFIPSEIANGEIGGGPTKFPEALAQRG